jgi:hypothetical protein
MFMPHQREKKLLTDNSSEKVASFKLLGIILQNKIIHLKLRAD